MLQAPAGTLISFQENKRDMFCLYNLIILLSVSIMSEKFSETIASGYTFDVPSIILGGAVHEKETVKDLLVKAPLSTFNRHGLVSGATGTGKTKGIQKIVESLSAHGVSSLVMDIKGDFSGISQPGTLDQRTADRHEKIGVVWNPNNFPTEFMTISDQNGVRLKATISEFGPVLLARVLELNETQQSALSLVFKFCDDSNLLLLDIKDLKETLKFISEEGKDEFEKEYGFIASATLGSILRQIIQVEEQGADQFFGEVSFDVFDLLRQDDRGYGFVNVLRLNDIQMKPHLFSTFMLCLLAEIYQKFPEEGDLDKPKLVLFIDEAHLIFKTASKELLREIETIIKLIRSKGIGIFFITQNPIDIPASVLAQLGMKVQYALRAFTAQDRKAIKLVSENYPITEFYKVDSLITELGIGEALVTVLNPKGIPTPLVHTLMCTPESRMDTISDSEKDQIIQRSGLLQEYNQDLDRESAYELLKKKVEISNNEEHVRNEGNETIEDKSSARTGQSLGYKIANSPLAKQIARTLTTEIVRGVLGVFGIKTTRRASHSTTRRRRRY